MGKMNKENEKKVNLQRISLFHAIFIKTKITSFCERKKPITSLLW